MNQPHGRHKGQRPSSDRRSGQAGNERGGPKPGPADTHLRGLHSLERLRDQVDLAAREIERLREENRSLLDRLKELEMRAEADPDLVPLPALHENPEVLRKKISSFIEAVDQYLQDEKAPDAS